MAGESFIALVNPSKRRRKKRGGTKRRARRSSARRSNPSRALARRSSGRVARRSYRRRRNPLSLGSFRGLRSGVMGSVMDAGVGAAGAILNDAAFTYIPTPAFLKTGIPGLITKAAGAFAVGFLAKYAVGAARAAKLTEGALTVLAYATLKPMVQTVMPLAGAEIEGLGFYSPGLIMQDTLNPMSDLNVGTPLQAYLSGNAYVPGGGASRESDIYDPTIDGMNQYI